MATPSNSKGMSYRNENPAIARRMSAKILAPIAPSQILGIGLNYRRHAEETKAKIPDYPVLFGKGLNSVQNPGDPIFLPTHLASSEVDYECELAVVIGRPCKNVSRRAGPGFRAGLYLRQ